MSYEPIARLEIENYGCIRKMSIALTPLHALIGPNDSGKSTVLRALRTATQFAAGDFGDNPNVNPVPFLPLLGDGAAVRLQYDDNLGYSFRTESSQSVYESATRSGNELVKWGLRGWNVPSPLRNWQSPEGESLRTRLTVATMVRFEPDFLRYPAPLIPERAGIAFADERGRGLASVFDAIVNRDVSAFIRIQDATKRLFPSIDKIGLSNSNTTHKVLAVTLVDGSRIDALSMSEGLLYFLAFSALRYIEGSRLFLVEEPENGLHPSRIIDVVGVLREISKQSQVVVATHSPLVINELKGDEVTVLTRDSEGTHAQLIKDTPNFEERSQVYALGELWVSYANGSDESPLLKGGTRP